MYYLEQNGKIVATSPNKLGEEWQETEQELVWSIVQNAFVDISEIDEQAEEQALAELEQAEQGAIAMPTVEERLEAMESALLEMMLGGADNG